MNKILLLAVGLLLFGCDKTSKNSENTDNAENAGVKNTTSEDNSTTTVREGAGSEISPQLKGIEDSAVRLKVDTINAAQEAQQAK